MRRIRQRKPRRTSGKLLNPVEEMTMPLAEHYGQRAERFRAAAQGFVDDRLRAVFPASGQLGDARPQHVPQAPQGIARTAGPLVGARRRRRPAILLKLEDRAGALRLRLRSRQEREKLLDVAAMATALAAEFAYYGRLLG